MLTFHIVNNFRCLKIPFCAYIYDSQYWKLLDKIPSLQNLFLFSLKKVKLLVQQHI